MTVTSAPMGLGSAQRTQLERLVTKARAALETDLRAQAEGRFGIHVDGTIEDEQALPDDASERATRRDLVEIIDHVRSLGESQSDAVARLLREAAFTHFNRLLAIRIAEAIGLLPESLGNGRQSRGFKDLGEIMPILGDDYWGYLLLCGDELAADAPALFDPRNPLLALAPSTPALEEIVALLGSLEATQLWLAPDTLGWAYQFFNTADERRLMREGAAAPRTSRELAVRNQFFTPRYVVDFLVQNTLGRRLIENDPSTPLLGELRLLVDPPTAPGPPLDLNETTVLDPACGSGHFLLGCYDLLERAWELQGVPPSESAPAIVASLWGVDIDARCAQVASAAVVLRARRHCRELPLPRPNIVTARSLPAGSPALVADLALTPEQGRLVERISEVLADVPLLGTLLKAEDALEQEIRHAAFGGDAGTLPLTEDAFGRVEADLMAHLQAVADQASSSVAERLLAAEADDALRLIDVVRNRYDVVLMNPPYGMPADGTEHYLQAAYADTWTELYAAFVERGLQMLKRGGYLGGLTSSQYFVTKRLGELRSRIIRDHRPLAIIDLGGGVLQGATVNTAAAILPRSRTRGATHYLDVTQLSAQEKSTAVRDVRDRAAARDIQGFAEIPGSPLALHMPDSLVEMWNHGSRLEPHLAKVRTGCKSFDDARFVRAAWEVGPEGLRRGWRRYLKGGEYQPYVASSHLVIDWRDDGRELRGIAQATGRLAQVMQSSAHWGTPGLCYPRMSSIGFAARAMPAGEIFADQSIAILPNEDVDPLVLLGLLNSTPVAEVLQVFGRGRATENGSMKSLPFGGDLLQRLRGLRPDVAELCDLFARMENGDETAATFVRPVALGQRPDEFAARREEAVAAACAAQERIDSTVRSALGIPTRLDPEFPSRVDLLRRVMPNADDAADAWANDLFSYFVGCAMGRWDVRLGTEPTPAPAVSGQFEEAPRCPPGMLAAERGLPEVDPAGGSPFERQPVRLLVDEPGHRWDVEAAVLEAAKALFEDQIVAMTEMLEIVGRKSVREYLRKQYFRAHLARYSKSRRKAPIYWPLTVASRKWGVWVYAPMLTRETLYEIASETARRERLASEAIARLHREQLEGGANRPARTIAAELDSEEKLTEELHRFRTEAQRIAGLGWEPNLDDGVVLCAAPLADLFPAWPDAKKAREELRKGQHEWAAVARWAGEL